MVGRSSVMSLSIFEDIWINNVQDNNGSYSVAVQLFGHSKTITYQYIWIYPERWFIICDWYWSMAYTCVMDRTKKVHLPQVFQHIIQVRWVQDRFQGIPYFLKTTFKILCHGSAIHNKWVKLVLTSCGNDIITCFKILFYASNTFPYTSFTMICLLLMTYIIMFFLQLFLSSTYILGLYDEHFWVRLTI